MTFYEKPGDLRAACRSGEYDGPTSGHAQGFVQANMVILPAADAAEFKQFCANNPKPCRYWRSSSPATRNRKTARPAPTCAATCRSTGCSVMACRSAT